MALKENWRLSMISLCPVTSSRVLSGYRLAWFAICLSIGALAQPPLVIKNQDPVSAGRYLALVADFSAALTINDVTKPGVRFVTSKADNPNLGLASYAFWLRLQVQNKTEEKKLVLQIESPLLDMVEFYAPEKDGHYRIVRVGEKYSFAQREYQSQNYIFNLNLEPGAIQTYYIKIKSTEQIQLPVKVGTEKAILESNSAGDLLSGIYFGIVAIMIFYNLFIYVSVQDKSYLYYVSYITFVGLTQACLHGYTFRYFWPGNSWLAIHSIFIIPALSGLGAIAFVNNFLEVKKFMPRVHKLSFVLGGIYVLGIILGLTDVFEISYNINDFIALLLSVYIMYIAVLLVRRKYRPARFFLFAWSFFLISVIVFVMKSKDVLPSNNFTNYVLEMGSAIEIMLLSFALADRINILRKEKEESQRKAFETLQENERIISQQNVILEAKVKERTAELETSNQNLKDAQVQLVNAEKMASLGQLTAGIAHEINNPINFVISNVSPLKRDINDLLQLLNRYNELKDEKHVSEKLKEIEELKKQLDTDYAIKEIDVLLRGIDEGAMRTSEIVKGLQNFSRLDEDGVKLANIHTGIDATLLLLNSALNGKNISVVKEYGNLGDIECQPGKLNQVFMNILNNAIQAFDDKAPNKEIRIHTEKTSQHVIIRIKDNAGGMTEEVKRRIFEPFFTTKGVGEGSGLGLSIVYGIIEKHKGKIEVESELGKGTEFIITLPLNAG